MLAKTVRAALLLAALSVAVVSRSWADDLSPVARSVPHVFLIVIDGLDARWLPRMERLNGLIQSGACPVTVPDARAVMPTRTNPNHVSLLSGVYPSGHGITGNEYWDRTVVGTAQPMDQGDLIEVETLFTVAEKEKPGLKTVGVFGKAKLGRLFGDVPKRQRGPDVLWAPGADTPDYMAAPENPSRVGDEAVLRAALQVLRPMPSLAAVSFSELDGACHRYGVESDEAHEALRRADAQASALIDALHQNRSWGKTVVILTADHGFNDVRGFEYLGFSDALLDAGVSGLSVVSDGGLVHVYVEGFVPGGNLDDPQRQRLRAAKAVAMQMEGVSEVVYRLPLGEGDEDDLIDPSWRLGHSRAGEMLLIGKPSVNFSDPYSAREVGLRGNHGGVAERTVPLVLCGGSELLARYDRTADVSPSAPDIGATVADLLGLRPPTRFDGRPLSPDELGRTLLLRPAG